MSKTTPQLRSAWKEFECDEDSMMLIPFGPDKIRVVPPAAEAFEALAAVMHHHGYEIRPKDTDSYNCRKITGGSGKSLHAYGIALDVNWTTNPYRDHEGTRAVRFSDKDTQDERALDVKAHHADTDMTEAMIADVRNIRTREGRPIFEWGGSWNSVKDCMHFELDVSPQELAAGLDPATVPGLEAYLLALRATGGEPLPVVEPVTVPVAPAVFDPHVVIARDGLRLRSGPSADSDIKRVVPAGTQVNVLRRENGWAQVDFIGDGLADGFMSLSFLRPLDQAPTPVQPDAGGGVGVVIVGGRADITGDVTPALVSRMFPNTGKSNITTHLPSVLAGLRAAGLGDRDMVLMALATIRAETEGFRPISEGRSGFNTRTHPFDLYDPGTNVARILGNTQPGDGARFKGRGFVQLTGRDNYRRVGGQLGVNLLDDPERANDSALAGRILGQFLKNCEGRARAALAERNLEKARKCVNGGTHGMSRFRDAYERGERVFPA
ncbi:M15 family metallopeptidase [Agrilutibacter solisilvae]|uniref:M15 family metallopeptidase n=1 Tax=Agrilutibacter solisilvae TaxID=2763317 RepID=A0A974XYD2_9GAMM|nr:M15 family metallopeptidase [Lysobacter solisilvae]QSX78057.1 M15 family metallopeptidase [Lysobacter solisilvae]